MHSFTVADALNADNSVLSLMAKRDNVAFHIPMITGKSLCPMLAPLNDNTDELLHEMQQHFEGFEFRGNSMPLCVSLKHQVNGFSNIDPLKEQYDVDAGIAMQWQMSKLELASFIASPDRLRWRPAISLPRGIQAPFLSI